MYAGNRQAKQLISDEFLVDHYKRHVLPYLDVEQRVKLQNILDRFVTAKYDLQKEIDSTIEFYSELNSLSRSLRLLGASEQRIEDLFSVLKKLQEVLFQLPRYRDHLPHQLRVYLLGCYLLSAQEEFAEVFSAKYGKIIADQVKKKDQQHYDLIRENLYYGLVCSPHILYDAWSFAGLCHDIGYAVQGTSMITSELRQIYKTLLPRMQLELSVRIRPSTLLQAQMTSFENCTALLFSNVAAELREYITILKNAQDHGIWSCFFLTSKDLADSIEEIIAKVKEHISDYRLWDLVSGFFLTSETEMAKNLLPVLYADTLAAIAFHNKPFLIYLSPFTALLIMSDTLQEWNRFSYIKSSRQGYLPRCVYVSLKGEPNRRVVDSEIYVYDSSPLEFYSRLKNNFDANKNGMSRNAFEKVKKEFLNGLTFIIAVGPPLKKYRFEA